MLIGKRAEKENSHVYQTLEGHTRDSLKVFFQYLKKNEKVLQHFCHKWGLNKDNFIKNTYATIYLHDCGKAIEEFQERIKKGKHSPDYPHSYHGLHIIFQLFSNKVNPFLPLYRAKLPFIELCSIMGHHSQLHKGIYENIDKISSNYNDEELNEFINKMSEVYYEIGFDNYAGEYSVEKMTGSYGKTNVETIDFIRKSIRDGICGSSCDIETKCKDKAIYTYMLSLLKTADIFSSKYFEDYAKKTSGIDVFESILDEEVLQNISGLSEEEILKGNKPYEYQRQLLNVSSNTILVAGCGRGKTEAAQIIANNIIRRNIANRIVFAMPTQVTSNAMADRMAKIYGSENVGLYHGKSLINKLMGLEGEEADYEEIKGENYESKNFVKPISITTVDHILYSLIHAYSSSDFTCGNLQTSVIIFDEIHYYEKDTTEYIFEALRILREMKIPHILMSATLPEFIIRDIMDKYIYVEDETGFKYTPFIMKRVHEPLIEKGDNEYKVNEDFKDKLLKNYKDGLRQTIIVNTVDKAQKIYREIMKADEVDKGDIILFHSRFTVDDRKKKEHQIFETKGNRPFILVTTQIIEVSIDVSCDVMFTELAPFDALAQRGGRLNRKGKDYVVNGIEQVMYVYDIDSTRPYAEDENDEKYMVLKDSWNLIPDGPLSYELVKSIVNNVYFREKLSITDYTNKWFVESSLFGNTPEDVRGKKVDEDTGGYFSSRSSNFKQIDVIPACKVADCTDFIEAAKNTVKIPQYTIFQYSESFYTQVIGNMEYKVCKFKYTYEEGITVGIEDSSGYFEF